MASAYTAIARRSVRAYQYQPPATSTPAPRIARPAITSVRAVGTTIFIEPAALDDIAGRTTRSVANPETHGARGARSADSAGRSPGRTPARHRSRSPRPQPTPGKIPPDVGASAQLDVDGALLDDDREARHLHGRVVGVGARRDVPAPGVPGAHDDPALEIA